MRNRPAMTRVIVCLLGVGTGPRCCMIREHNRREARRACSRAPARGSRASCTPSKPNDRWPSDQGPRSSESAFHRDKAMCWRWCSHRRRCNSRELRGSAAPWPRPRIASEHRRQTRSRPRVWERRHRRRRETHRSPRRRIVGRGRPRRGAPCRAESRRHITVARAIFSPWPEGRARRRHGVAGARRDRRGALSDESRASIRLASNASSSHELW